jgi:predicted deacylase
MIARGLEMAAVFQVEIEPSTEPPAAEPGEHLLGAFVGRTSGPTLIVIGSLHGNEPGGVKAIRRVIEKFDASGAKFQGRVYFLSGNTRALIEGKRFLDYDLNRSWTPHNLSIIGTNELTAISEGQELNELDRLLDCILVTAEDEVYVLDLHSTSAEGVPFATVGDTLRNRRFAQSFPITILLGIEEQLEGTMLEYLNNAGAVTLGFEGGQHASEETVGNHEALIWLALVNSGIVAPEDVQGLDQYRRTLAAKGNGSRIFEVRYRHPVVPDDDFEMKPGFNNFDPITRGQPLALDRNGTITAPESGVILMPLYQKLGEDGFFIGRRVAAFWLFLSAVLRRLGVQELIRVLPGVWRDPADPSTLRVYTHIARLFPLQIFHLLGYRRRRWEGNELTVSRRKHDASSPFKERRKTSGR